MSAVPRKKLVFRDGKVVEVSVGGDQGGKKLPFGLQVKPGFPFKAWSLDDDTPGVRHRDRDGTPVMTCQGDIDSIVRANPGIRYGKLRH